MSNSESFKRLTDTVISNGFCVGCGACAVPEDSPFNIATNEYGQFGAVQERSSQSGLVAKTSSNFEAICPFGDDAPSEDELGRDLFQDACVHDSQVGYYQHVFAGHVAEGAFRDGGSSGGMSSWILHELLQQDCVDHVIHVRSYSDGSQPNNLLFGYTISSSAQDTQSGAKSRYYPIELSDVLHKVRNQPGRYAIIGLPCFIKSVRLLQRQEAVFAERIKYCVGLVCGHLKSSRYAESLAWQMGIKPNELKAIDFRVKSSSQPANRYSTSATGPDGEKVVSTNKLFGTDWGAGAFKYKACDYCDDVFAETADVVLGDAWLPEYVKDSRGTNIVVTRNAVIQSLIDKARIDKRLELDEISITKAIQSQDAGLRHRKKWISYRLFLAGRDGAWTPIKRALPSKKLKPRYERRRQRLRGRLRDLSHTAFLAAKERQDLNLYLIKMDPVYRKYQQTSKSWIGRGLLVLKRVAKRLCQSLSRGH